MFKVFPLVYKMLYLVYLVHNLPFFLLFQFLFLNMDILDVKVLCCFPVYSYKVSFLYPKVKLFGWSYDVDMSATIWITCCVIVISVNFRPLVTRSEDKHKIYTHLSYY